MKHLQNNFTTPEQSKRLLELGLPADSADLVYFELEDFNIDDVIEGHHILSTPLVNCPIVGTDAHNVSITELKENNGDSRVLPCWSVGRLIEILKEISEDGCMVYLGNAITSDNMIESLVRGVRIELPSYKRRQERLAISETKQTSTNADRTLKVLEFANAAFGDMIDTDDDDYIGMQDFLY